MFIEIKISILGMFFKSCYKILCLKDQEHESWGVCLVCSGRIGRVLSKHPSNHGHCPLSTGGCVQAVCRLEAML